LLILFLSAVAMALSALTGRSDLWCLGILIAITGDGYQGLICYVICINSSSCKKTHTHACRSSIYKRAVLKPKYNPIPTVATTLTFEAEEPAPE
jgi:hypothetical protein